MDIVIIIIVLLLILIISWISIKYERIDCPRCGSRMKKIDLFDTTVDTWVCPKCGCKTLIEEH